MQKLNVVVNWIHWDVTKEVLKAMLEKMFD